MQKKTLFIHNAHKSIPIIFENGKAIVKFIELVEDILKGTENLKFIYATSQNGNLLIFPKEFIQNSYIEYSLDEDYRE